jgi:hypothetical protein
MVDSIAEVRDLGNASSEKRTPKCFFRKTYPERLGVQEMLF